MRSIVYKEVQAGAWTASNGPSPAAGSNEDNYHSNNISLSEGMEGKDKCLCVRVCACPLLCVFPSISLAVSPSFPESQYLFVSPQ